MRFMPYRFANVALPLITLSAVSRSRAVKKLRQIVSLSSFDSIRLIKYIIYLLFSLVQHPFPSFKFRKREGLAVTEDAFLFLNGHHG
jgi:hypothetical protein